MWFSTDVTPGADPYNRLVGKWLEVVGEVDAAFALWEWRVAIDRIVRRIGQILDLKVVFREFRGDQRPTSGVFDDDRVSNLHALVPCNSTIAQRYERISTVVPTSAQFHKNWLSCRSNPKQPCEPE